MTEDNDEDEDDSRGKKSFVKLVKFSLHICVLPHLSTWMPIAMSCPLPRVEDFINEEKDSENYRLK